MRADLEKSKVVIAPATEEEALASIRTSDDAPARRGPSELTKMWANCFSGPGWTAEMLNTLVAVSDPANKQLFSAEATREAFAHIKPRDVQF